MQPDPDNVGGYLISARSFDEYRAMFALVGSDLSGSVLDCPGGASSFTACANQAGASAIAADPVYARPRHSLGALVMAEVERGSAHTAAGADRYIWDFHGDPGGHARVRRAWTVRLQVRTQLADLGTTTDMNRHPDLPR